MTTRVCLNHGVHLFQYVPTARVTYNARRRRDRGSLWACTACCSLGELPAWALGYRP